MPYDLHVCYFCHGRCGNLLHLQVARQEKWRQLAQESPGDMTPGAFAWITYDLHVLPTKIIPHNK